MSNKMNKKQLKKSELLSEKKSRVVNGPMKQNHKDETLENFMDKFRIRESYTSLLLGLVVVIIALLLVVSVVRSIRVQDILTNGNTDTFKTEQTPIPTEAQSISSKTYTVKDNESLWDVAVQVYGDGYRWPDIAKANNLTNPDSVSTGMVLTIPR